MAYSWDNRVDFVVRYMYGKLEKNLETHVQKNIKTFKFSISKLPESRWFGL